MNWGNSDLYYLILIPLLAFFLGKIKSYNESKSNKNLADPEILEQISPSNSIIINRRNFSYSLLLFFIFSLLYLGILRPQWGFALKETKRRGLDLVVAIDLSESMLATDISPTRLDRARREVTDLLQNLQGDRISLVSFAGVAFIDSPLTLDYSAFKLFLDTLKTSDIPIQGTNIEAALDKSLEALGLLDKDLNKIASAPIRDRAIILITDGEELQGNYENAAILAKENNVRIYIMGVGTTTGSPITLDKSFKRDKEGKLVLTKLNPEVLKKLAYETGGIYIESVSSQKDTDIIYKDGIKKALKDSDLSSNDNKIWNEYFQYPLLLAIFLIIFRLWKEQTAATMLLFFYLYPSLCLAENSETIGANAKDLYHNGKYLEANEEFQRAKEISKDDFRFYLGSGSSLYREKKFEDSEKEFYEAAAKAKNNIDKSASLFNAGNSQVQQQKLEEALNSYEQSLKLNPADTQIKDNIEYVKKLMQQQKEKDKKKDNKEQQNKDNKDNKESNSEKSDSNKSEQNKEENQSQERNNNDEKQDGENKEKENESKTEESKPEKQEEEQKDNNNSTEEKKSSEEKEQNSDNKSETQGNPGDNKNNPQQQEESNPLLDSIEEKSDNRDKYRLKKSNEQLKNYGLSKTDIEKNW